MPIPIRERGYPHPELLAETEWLASRLSDPLTNGPISLTPKWIADNRPTVSSERFNAAEKAARQVWPSLLARRSHDLDRGGEPLVASGEPPGRRTRGNGRRVPRIGHRQRDRTLGRVAC